MNNTDDVRTIPYCRHSSWTWGQVFSAFRLGIGHFAAEVACEVLLTILQYERLRLTVDGRPI